MTTEAELLRAVLSEPESDSPRIAFADWLEEQGEAERAEFIRVQCELEVMRLRGAPGLWSPGDPDDPADHPIHAFRRRDRELLLRYGFDWLPKIGIKSILHDGGDAEGVNFEICTGTEKGSGIQCDFRHGFVHAITCTAADFLEHADALCWHPKQKCRACDGSGKGLFIPRERWADPMPRPDPCPACRGTGLRPCPETAQPIREATLTTWPDMSQVSPDWKHYRTCREALSARWPGITFHLPEESV